MRVRLFCLLLVGAVPAGVSRAEVAEDVRMIPVGEGWAKNSVNAVVFRTSTTSHAGFQFTSYYDEEGYVVLAKRKHGSTEWEVRRTRYQGNVRDAHNAISIGVDGSGVIHVSWDHHNHPLRYARGVAPGSLELTDKLPMTGRHEAQVTYPQFYRLADGDLLFLYRDGASGRGDAMLNRYSVKTGEWKAVQHPLISGEGRRNPYLNTMAVDARGGVHVSWVWRESPDVASNHDLCYAFSPDGGVTWTDSKGAELKLPITESTAEVAWRIPQGRELINQTSMAASLSGDPVIASYWTESDSAAPQYRVVWRERGRWRSARVGEREGKFSLSGGGTKRIPISRPQVVAGKGGELRVIFRDEERGGRVTAAVSKSLGYRNWELVDLTEESVGSWEPTLDMERWRTEGVLDVFVQRVGQGDGEGLEDLPPQQVSILEWRP